MITRDVYQFTGHAFNVLDWRVFHEKRDDRTHRLMAVDNGRKLGRRPVIETDWVPVTEPIVLFCGNNLESNYPRMFTVVDIVEKPDEPSVVYCIAGRMISICRKLQSGLRMS